MHDDSLPIQLHTGRVAREQLEQLDLVAQHICAARLAAVQSQGRVVQLKLHSVVGLEGQTAVGIMFAGRQRMQPVFPCTGTTQSCNSCAWRPPCALLRLPSC